MLVNILIRLINFMANTVVSKLSVSHKIKWALEKTVNSYVIEFGDW
jgi:hypothetical protein